jgi:hypothetical protein
MGIFIISFLVLVFGIVSLIIYKQKYSGYLFKGDSWYFAGLLCTVVSSAVIIICGIICLCINADINIDLEYQNMLLERKSIEYRLERAESEDSFMTNGGVYYDAVQFNNNLRGYKTYTHNFWVGWFWADKPAELEYIEFSLEGS